MGSVAALLSSVRRWKSSESTSVVELEDGPTVDQSSQRNQTILVMVTITESFIGDSIPFSFFLECGVVAKIQSPLVLDDLSGGVDFHLTDSECYVDILYRNSVMVVVLEGFLTCLRDKVLKNRICLEGSSVFLNDLKNMSPKIRACKTVDGAVFDETPKRDLKKDFKEGIRVITHRVFEVIGDGSFVCGITRGNLSGAFIENSFLVFDDEPKGLKAYGTDMRKHWATRILVTYIGTSKGVVTKNLKLGRNAMNDDGNRFSGLNDVQNMGSITVVIYLCSGTTILWSWSIIARKYARKYAGKGSVTWKWEEAESNVNEEVKLLMSGSCSDVAHSRSVNDDMANGLVFNQRVANGFLKTEILIKEIVTGFIGFMLEMATWKGQDFHFNDYFTVGLGNGSSMSTLGDLVAYQVVDMEIEASCVMHLDADMEMISMFGDIDEAPSRNPDFLQEYGDQE